MTTSPDTAHSLRPARFRSAISILIFLFVGVISVIGFRQTKRFEEMS